MSEIKIQKDNKTENLSKAELYETIKYLKEYIYKIKSLDDFHQIDIATSEIKFFIYSKKYLSDKFESNCKKWGNFTKTYGAKKLWIYLLKILGLNFGPIKKVDELEMHLINAINIMGIYNFILYHIERQYKFSFKAETLNFYNNYPLCNSIIEVILAFLNRHEYENKSEKIIKKNKKDFELGYYSEYQYLDFYILKNNALRPIKSEVIKCIYKFIITNICETLINYLESMLKTDIQGNYSGLESVKLAESLTKEEFNALKATKDSCTQKEAADKLNKSITTIQTQLKSARDKISQITGMKMTTNELIKMI